MNLKPANRGFAIAFAAAAAAVTAIAENPRKGFVCWSILLTARGRAYSTARKHLHILSAAPNSHLPQLQQVQSWKHRRTPVKSAALAEEQTPDWWFVVAVDDVCVVVERSRIRAGMML